MWNVNGNVILIRMRATETVSKSFRKYLSNKLGRHEIGGTAGKY
jgi:hypothetical protein